MTPLLQVEDLNVTFFTRRGPLHAVRGISFELFEGETLGIVGESGCGKSATAKAIMQLVPKEKASLSGKILYQGHNLLNYPLKQMEKVRGKEIGMIFQDPMTSLNPTMKIGQQIIEGYLRHFPLVCYAEAKRHILNLLEQVGLLDPEKILESYPHTLSGGMRQRVMIALVLACQPKVILADEPTTALDVTIQAQILNLMQDVQERTQTSMILITHDLSIVAKCCDRVLVMYAGRIVESASVYDLFAHPQHPYTQRLLEAIPKLNQPKIEPLIPIEGTPPHLTRSLPHCGFYERCSKAMAICAQEIPPLFSISSNEQKTASRCTHQSACFKHRESS